MNTTTLNTTTLDGGVIIKRGEGGGGATINNQDKVVDITENGTTEVVADGGFTGLGKVTINTEVSGGESGGSDWHYFDVSALDMTDPTIGFALIMCYMTIKFAVNDEVMVGPLGLYEMYQGFEGENIKTLAFGVDYTQRVIYNGKDSSYGDGVEEVKAQGISLTEISKEQFYSLD